MDDSLLSFSESRLRTIFGRWGGGEAAGDAEAPPPPLPPGVDPLYPSLDVEEPPEKSHGRRAGVDGTEYQRPPWDPRDRWRQMRPSQPYHAPPESDLPAQFRYEDLSVYEKSETMEPEQDRLLAWLQERFDRGLQFKYNGQLPRLTAEQAIRHQVFTPVQLLDDQLGNSLGLASADRALLERRRRLLAAEAAAAVTSATPAADSSSKFTSDGWEVEGNDDTATSAGGAMAAAAAVSMNDEVEEFGQFAKPQQQAVVVTVHEAAKKPQRKQRQLLECGDQTSESTIECELDFKRVGCHPRQKRQQRVAQFGDAPSGSGCEDSSSVAGDSGRVSRKMREETV